MTFSPIKPELAARGFAYLDDTRLGQFVNWAYHELQTAAPWPWRVTVSTTSSWSGTAITITNADRILQAGGPEDGPGYTRRRPMEYGELLLLDLPHTGTHKYFSAIGDSSTPGSLVVTILPTPTPDPLTVKVVYLDASADLSGSTTPDIPPQYHGTLLDIATRMAYRDNGENDAAQVVQAGGEQELDRMEANHLAPEHEDAQ